MSLPFYDICHCGYAYSLVTLGYLFVIQDKNLMLPGINMLVNLWMSDRVGVRCSTSAMAKRTGMSYGKAKNVLSELNLLGLVEPETYQHRTNVTATRWTLTWRGRMMARTSFLKPFERGNNDLR